MISRRQILGATALGAGLSSTLSFAQGLSVPVNKPFETLDKPVMADNGRVIEFVAYTCTACQRFHGAIQAWANTLPKNLQFQVVPIPLMNSNDELTLLLYRAALSWSQPNRTRAFDMALLENLSINGNNPNNKALHDAIKLTQVDHAAAMRVPEKKLIQTMMYWRDKAAEYNVKATPTVAAGGRYTTNPDAIPGREDLFPMILNGLVSRIV